MTHSHHLRLSRREREIVDLLYRSGEASVADVLESMAEPPSYSAVRAILALLVAKGHVRRRRIGRKHLFSPCLPQSKARRSALRHVMETFFGGSVEAAVASILDAEAARLSDEELGRLAALIEEARRKE